VEIKFGFGLIDWRRIIELKGGLEIVIQRYNVWIVHRGPFALHSPR